MHVSHSSEDLQVEQLGGILSQVFQEMGLGDSPLSAAGPTSGPILLQDLQANAAELSEICQVLSERSLNAAQLQSLAVLELAILTLEDRVQDFVAHF
jgi:hypothetical protein